MNIADVRKKLEEMEAEMNAGSKPPHLLAGLRYLPELAVSNDLLDSIDKACTVPKRHPATVAPNSWIRA